MNVSGKLKKTSIHIALIALFGLLAYSNTFDVPFQWDDGCYIVENPVIREIKYLAAVSDAERLNLSYNVSQSLRTRTVAYLTFLMNYKINGLSVAGYHAFNLAIHILNAFLVYALIILAFRTPRLGVLGLQIRCRWIALLSALIFVAHPLQTQAVTYITQRFASLAAFFCLLSLTAYAQSRLSEESKKKYLLYAVSLFSLMAAMKTKENAFTFPLVIALFEIMFFNSPNKKRAMLLLPVFLTMLMIPFSILDAGLDAGAPIGDAVAGASSTTNIPRWDYFLTQFSVIAAYIRLLVFPINQNLDYDYPISRSFFEPRVFVSFVFLLSLFCLTAYLWIRLRKSEPGIRLVSFGVVWFFTTLLVESSVIALDDVIFEHRAYLPSIGFIIAAATGASIFLGKIKNARIRAVFITFFIFIPLALSAAAYARNNTWKTEISLWEDVVMKSPNKARGYLNLGEAYERRGYTDKAIEHYLIALKLSPSDDKTLYNLGVAYDKKGLTEQAKKYFKVALDLNPNHAKTHVNLGKIFKDQGMIEKAVSHYKTALSINPGIAEAHNNLGNAYSVMGLNDKALEQYRLAIALKPDYAAAHFNLGLAYLEKNLPSEARREFEATLRIDPTLGQARQYLSGMGAHPAPRSK